MSPKTLNIFLLFLSFNLVIKGQDISDSLFTTSLDSIVVSTTRYTIPLVNAPFSISSQENINAKSLVSLKEVFQNTSGITVNSRSNYSQGDKILLRGIGTRSAFGVRGIKIFLDGIPLTFPDGQAQLNNLDIQSIDKVEVVKGPSSTLYGNSLGGVVFFKSKMKRAFYIRPEISISSFGYQRYSLSSGGNFLNGNYSIGIYHTQAKGFREHSEAEYYGANLNLKMELFNDFFLSVVSNYYNAPYLLNPSSINKSDAEKNPTMVRSSVKNFGSGKKIDQFQNGISLLYQINNNSKLTTTLYGITRSLKNSIPGRIIELDRFYGGARIEFENKFDLFNNSIFTLIGIDYEAQYDTRKEFENGGVENYSLFNPNNLFSDIIYKNKLIHQNENVKSLGIFSHLNFKLTEKLLLFGGIRIDDYLFEIEEKLAAENYAEIKMDNFSKMLGFSYKLKNNLTLFGNYSNGFQTPTTNELSNNPLREGGFNSNLNPEIINNFELGIRGWWNSPNIFSNISIYQMNISDMLISYQSESEENYYRNAGSAINLGIEFDLEYHPLSNIFFLSSYSFMNFKFDNYLVEQIVNGIKEEFQLKDNYLPGVPKHNIKLSTQYRFPLGISSVFSYSWTDKYFTNDFNGPLDGSEILTDYINDSYSLFNFGLLYQFRINFAEFNIKLTVDNLFDVRYNDSIVPNAFGNNFFEPAPGRTYNITVSAVIL